MGTLVPPLLGGGRERGGADVAGMLVMGEGSLETALRGQPMACWTPWGHTPGGTACLSWVLGDRGSDLRVLAVCPWSESLCRVARCPWRAGRRDSHTAGAPFLRGRGSKGPA